MAALYKKNGFSLIELMVSATVIAVLTVIGVVSYSSVNKRSRDVKRKSDMEQVRSALEMYRSDQGEYPNQTLVTVGELSSFLVSGGYMPAMPGDTNSETPYYYQGFQSPINNLYTSYCVCAHLETLTTPVDTCTEGTMPASCNYRLKNP